MSSRVCVGCGRGLFHRRDGGESSVSGQSIRAAATGAEKMGR